MMKFASNLQRVAADYKQMDGKDKKQFWIDGILNNALYILMLIFIVYTATQREAFLTLGSLANLITQVGAYLPMALGIAGCIVLTGTELSARRVTGLTAAIAAVFLQKTDFANKMLDSLPEATPFWLFVTLLYAIAACVIGGVSFVGGTGKISGIILGVVVLRIIFVALTMLGVDSSSLYIIKGAIILCACALDMRKYLVKK